MGSDSFVTFVLEQLSGVDALGCRAMFGGHGLYTGATFFGIVFGGRVYFKTDDATAAEYESLGMRPFRPNDRQVLKSYYEVPADVLEDRARLLQWAEAAARAAGGAGGRADTRADTRADGGIGAAPRRGRALRR